MAIKPRNKAEQVIEDEKEELEDDGKCPIMHGFYCLFTNCPRFDYEVGKCAHISLSAKQEGYGRGEDAKTAPLVTK